MPKINQDIIKVMEVMSYDALERKIRDLINPPDIKGNRSYRYYIRETFPGFAVVRDTNEGKFYKVEYMVDAQENVSLGNWHEAEYVLQAKPNGSTKPPEPKPETIVLDESAQVQEEDISGLTRLTEAKGQEGSRKFRMTVIKPGWNLCLDGSQGDKYYTVAFIQSLLPLVEGAKAYADHPTGREERERPARSVRELVGRWSDARQEPDGRATAVFNLLESADWLRPVLVEAEKNKTPVFVGPSINGYGVTKFGEVNGRRGKIVESAKLLQSIDIVTEPGAGGTVDKLLESVKTKQEDDDMDWSKITLEELREHRPDLIESAGEEELTEVKSDFQRDLDAIKESVTAVSNENKQLRDELQVERNKVTVKTKISELLRESKLPEVSQRRLARVLESGQYIKDGAVDEAALKEAVDSAVIDEREYLSKITESGKVTDMGSGGDNPDPVKLTESVQGKLDNMFGVAEPEKEGQ